ncbi:MAG TPA: hypothetical protein VH186_14270 [Chloroflexia bacterium]|nr:hypothetical protein [Chloroflexia bacterium]
MKDIKRENLSEIITQCREQTELFIRHEPYDQKYCLEIWRRAIVNRDEAAWEATITQYAVFVRRWLSQRLANHPALRFEEEVLVNGVFINFFRFVGPDKFSSFNNLAGVLQYLKLCCATIVADAQRDYQARNLNLPLETTDPQEDSGDSGLSHGERLSSDFDLEAEALNRADRSTFWNTVWRKLPDPTDRLLVYLRYVLDMPPREITQLYPQHFPDVAEVYRRNKNLLWRLRNNPEF